MFRTIFIVLCVLLLSACSAQRLVLSLHTTNLINPDAKHQGLTLYVKIFQLNSADLFNKQSTNVLWKSTLGKIILFKNPIDRIFSINLFI